MGTVATQWIESGDDLSEVVAKVRAQVIATGEDRLPTGSRHLAADPDEQRALLQVLRDGSYATAAARVGAEDPELASE